MYKRQISAFGRNAALPHYAPKRETAAVLTDGLLLIDSGGQYEAGTTDITRMTAVGRIDDDMKRDVTLVLKAHIALARAVVPAGVSGSQLDAIARAPLWAKGLDFGHGTGHGVGCRLNVHEGPFHISPRATKTGELGLQAGILVSDEPGLYLSLIHICKDFRKDEQGKTFGKKPRKAAKPHRDEAPVSYTHLDVYKRQV